MHEFKPSRTALGVARRRAVHQLLDKPKVFDDPLAIMILAVPAAELTSDTRNNHPISRGLRAFVTARSRYAEDQLARSVGEGVRQYVLLGAGLDTFAYRNPFAEVGLRVFEVDHPSTQQWKREQIQAAGIQIPASTVFAPVNFERQALADGLQAVGFDTLQPAFFAWLGVVPYLTEEAFRATVSYIAAMPAGSGVVFDYGLAESELGLREKLARDFLSNRVALAGEPFRLFFKPSDLAAQLRELGFSHIEDMDGDAINQRYFGDRSDGLQLAGASAHLLCARR